MSLSIPKLARTLHLTRPSRPAPTPTPRAPVAVDAFEPAPPGTAGLPPQRPMPFRPAPAMDEEKATRAATALYRALLGREPDPDGLRAHVEHIVGGGLAETVNAFVESPELAGRMGSVSVPDQTKALYRAFLGREPDEGGDLSTRAAIARGNLAEVTFGVLTSAEYAERLARPEVPPKPPEPETQPFAKRTGIVRASRSAFADDQGEFNAMGATLMSAAWMYKNDRPRLEKTLEELKKNGFDYIRALGVVGDADRPDWWDGREIDWRDPAYAETIAGLTDLAYDKFGLRVEWTLIGDGQKNLPDERDRFRLMDTFVNMSRGREQKIMHFEVANEAWQNGFAGDEGREQLRRLTKYLNDRTDILVSASTPEGPDADEYARIYRDGVADMATVHFDRDMTKVDGHWRPVRQPWEFQYLAGPRLGTNNEPVGPGSSVASETDPRKLVAAAITSYISGLPGYVFHSNAGVRGDENLMDMQGFTSFKQLKAFVPADLTNWSRKNANWADSPFRVYARRAGGELVPDSMWPDEPGMTGAVRSYGAVKGSEFFVFPMGIKDRVVMEPRRNAEFDVIDPMTGEVVDHKRLNAGERFELSGAEMFVLKGRYV